MSTDLVSRLRHGCVMHPRRWSGDTHDDLGGSIRESETDAVMAEAADYIDTLRAQLGSAELRDSQMQDAAKLLLARAEAAEAECARLRADADRFRFIAAQPTDEWMSDSGDSFRTLTEAVDASMAARTKEQQA